MNIFGQIGHAISSVGKGIQDGVNAVGTVVEKGADLSKNLIDSGVDEFEKIPVIGNNPLTKALGSGVKGLAEATDLTAHFGAGLVEGVASMATGVVQLAGGIVELGDPQVRADFGATVAHIASDPGSFFSAIGHNIADDFKKDGAQATGNLASLLVPVGGELKAATEGTRLAEVGAAAMRVARGGSRAADGVADTAKVAESGAAAAESGAATAESGASAATTAARTPSALERELTRMRTSLGDALGKKSQDTFAKVETTEDAASLKTLDLLTQTPAPKGVAPRLWAQFRETVQKRIESLPAPVRAPFEPDSVLRDELNVVNAGAMGPARVMGHLIGGTAKVGGKAIVGTAKVGLDATVGVAKVGVQAIRDASTLGREGSVGLGGLVEHMATNTRNVVVGTAVDSGKVVTGTVKGLGSVGANGAREMAHVGEDFSRQSIKFVQAHKTTAYLSAAGAVVSGAVAPRPVDGADAAAQDPNAADAASAIPVGPGAPNAPEDVTAVQQALGVPATGQWDDATQTALVNFQNANGLGGAGSVDAQTWAALSQSTPA